MPSSSCRCTCASCAGVVDSGDLSLNVSRELLQQDAVVESMRSALTKRVLDMLEKLAKDEPEKYATFWKEFGRVLKEGPAEDPANREKIAGLLRFSTTHTDSATPDQSLADYVGAESRARPEDASGTSLPTASLPPVAARTSRSSASGASRCCC